MHNKNPLEMKDTVGKLKKIY